VGAGAPPAGTGKPDQAGEHESGDRDSSARYRYPGKAQHAGDERGEYRGAEQREQEPAQRRPPPGGPPAVAHRHEQRGRADRGGDDSGQEQNCEHDASLPNGDLGIDYPRSWGANPQPGELQLNTDTCRWPGTGVTGSASTNATFARSRTVPLAVVQVVVLSQT